MLSSIEMSFFRMESYIFMAKTNAEGRHKKIGFSVKVTNFFLLEVV